MPVTPYSKVAFRCRNCGRLHTSDDAAEAAHPHACRVCGRGVIYNADGTKSYDPANWEVLASVSPKRLAELGISADDVEKHEQWHQFDITRSMQRHLRDINVTAEDGPGTKDGVG